MRIQPVRIAVILAIVLLSLGLHVYAASTLPVDNDERTYVTAAAHYAEYLRSGHPKELAYYSYNSEHPALFKILYGAAFLLQPPMPNPDKPLMRPRQAIQTAELKPWILTGRYTSNLLAVLAALALALLNPLAGFLMSIQSVGVKYTSEMYLESLPLLASLLSALAYWAWIRQAARPGKKTLRDHFWLAVSAGFLGMTAASKYVYCAVGIAIVIHFAASAIGNRALRRYIPWILGWGVLALASFYVLDPYMYKQPLVKLTQTLHFYLGYTKSKTVVTANYPIYQPFVWLANSAPQLFPVQSGSYLVALDLPILLLAAAGAYRLLKRNALFFTWLVVGLIVLLAWPTKWTQYVLIILAPLSMSAAEGIGWLLSYPLKWWRRRRAASPEKAQANLN